MGCADVANKIKLADARAAEEIKSIIEMNLPFICEKVYPHVRGYILSRFLLDDDTEETNLRKLVSSSISKTLEISDGDLSKTDLSERCISAPSTETKLVILMFRLEEALGIKLKVSERVNAETLEDLVEAVTLHLNETYADKQ